MLRTITAIRYVAPLREGGSLPALVEADDDGTYVVKFRAAAQGPKALVAEIVAGEAGHALGLPIPDIVLIHLDAVLGRSEPHAEIKQLIQGSAGLNLGIDYLPGSLAFDPLNARDIDPIVASRIVWFDALMSNVDRTARNTNMLLWHKRVWLIDHGAALYFHHAWDSANPLSPFRPIKDHVLLRRASRLADVDEEMAARLDEGTLRGILDAVPDDWLNGEARFPDAATHRAAYLDYLVRRLAAPRAFVEEAQHARAQLL